MMSAHLLGIIDKHLILSGVCVYREPVESYYGNYSKHLNYVESYYGNYSKHLNYEIGRNLTLLSLEKSQEILEGVEQIELIANQTLKDIYSNFKMVSQGSRIRNYFISVLFFVSILAWCTSRLFPWFLS